MKSRLVKCWKKSIRILMVKPTKRNYFWRLNWFWVEECLRTINMRKIIRINLINNQAHILKTTLLKFLNANVTALKIKYIALNVNVTVTKATNLSATSPKATKCPKCPKYPKYPKATPTPLRTHFQPYFQVVQYLSKISPLCWANLWQIPHTRGQCTDRNRMEMDGD